MKTAATPEAKIKMIKASTRCLNLGLASLMIPMLGPVLGLFALVQSFSARRRERYFWNPAKRQRVFGLLIASLAIFIWGAVDAIVFYNAFESYLYGS
jgi:hypothetical protein